jgi:hypothetical protein
MLDGEQMANLLHWRLFMQGRSEFANQLVLKAPDITLLRANQDGYPLLAQELQKVFDLHKSHGKLVLPELRAFGNDSVAIFSDYGGESSGNYNTYSALVCGFGYTGLFHQKMKTVREKHALGQKEIAFKDFRYGPLRRALPDYLEALDSLPGFLCTLAVDKRVTTLFGPQEKSARERLSVTLEAEGLGEWKPDVAEKLLRIVHFTAFLTALLAHDGQKLFWMTDNDAVCETQNTHKQVLTLFQRVLSIYCRPSTSFPLIGGAVPFDPRSVEMLDLLSVADVAAGSIEPCIPKHGFTTEGDPQIKRGADDVLRWLAHDGIGLKKANFFIRCGRASGTIESGAVYLGQ